MYPEVLTPSQFQLLSLIRNLSQEFGLVGGTAIALQIGHRESIDFDLFKKGRLDILKIRKAVTSSFPITSVKVENPDEYTLIANNVQLTFFNFPFEIKFDVIFEGISMPSLLTLASMKAFALGKRAKWKDYIDLYFILKEYRLKEVVSKAEVIFKGEFSEKLFREQLSFHEDIDYTEKISFKPGFEVEDSEVKRNLQEISLV